MKRSSLTVTLVLAASVGAGVVGFASARRARSPAPVAPESAVAQAEGTVVLRVPHAKGNLVLNGDLDDPGWRGCARTQAFLGPDGVTAARPHSEARFVWADDHLYVGLYAADEDIHARSTEHDVSVLGDDHFELVFSDGRTEHVLSVTPTGVVTDGERPAGSGAPLAYGWESRAHVSTERDGTPNDTRDIDEEWVIEMAIPFDALGLAGEKGERLGLSMTRCDILRNGNTLCGAWGTAPPGAPGGDPAVRKKGVLVLD